MMHGREKILWAFGEQPALRESEVADAPTLEPKMLNSPLTKSSHPEKDTSYGMTNGDCHTACGSGDRVNRLRQRADMTVLLRSGVRLGVAC